MQHAILEGRATMTSRSRLLFWVLVAAVVVLVVVGVVWHRRNAM